MIFNKNKSDSLVQADDESSIANWLDYEEELEGQLAIDVYQTEKKIIIKSTIAGVDPENLNISLHNDLLTIKGRRTTSETIPPQDYLYQECY